MATIPVLSRAPTLPYPTLPYPALPLPPTPSQMLL